MRSFTPDLLRLLIDKVCSYQINSFIYNKAINIKEEEKNYSL
jgi:hypothetical protein